MNRDVAILREAVVKLTQMLVKMGLTVTQQGTQAYVVTDPKTLKPLRVNIPFIPDNATLDLILAIQGFIDHECAHCLFTDWAVVGKAYALDKKKGGSQGSHAMLHNIFEDTFIERAMMKKFPGSAYNMKQLHEFFIEKITKPALARTGGDENRELQVLLVVMARAWSGQRVFIDFLKSYEPQMGALSKDFMTKGVPPELIARVEKIASSADALKVSEDFHKILFPPKPPQPKPQPQPQPPQQPEPQKGDGEPDEDDKAQSNQGDGEKEHEDETDDKPSGKADDEDKSEDEGEGDSDGVEDSASDPADDEDAQDGDAGASDDDVDASEDQDEDAEGGNDQGETDDTAGSSEDDDADGAAPGDDDASEDDEGAEEAASGSSGSSDEDKGNDGAEDDDGTTGGSGKDEDGEAEDGGSSGSKDEDASDDEDGEIGSSGRDDSDEPGEEISDGEGQDGGDAWNVTGEKLIDEDAELDFSTLASEVIARDSASAIQHSNYRPYTTDYDVVEKIKVPKKFDRAMIAEIDAACSDMVGIMQHEIERLLASRSAVFNVPGYRSGRLNASSLHRLRVNDDRVFSRRKENKAKKTAVYLLVDNSGSMACGRQEVAMTAAYALSQTLERCNMVSQVAGFTTKKGVDYYDVLAEQNKMGVKFSRIDGIYMPIYKSFDERMTPLVRERFAYGAKSYRGIANIDGECVERAGRALLERNEDRKVLIVLSDGLPSAGISQDLYWHLKNTVQSLEKSGVETIGIGINTDEVKKFYPRHMVLKDVKSLPALIMSELRRILLG